MGLFLLLAYHTQHQFLFKSPALIPSLHTPSKIWSSITDPTMLPISTSLAVLLATYAFAFTDDSLDAGFHAIHPRMFHPGSPGMFHFGSSEASGSIRGSPAPGDRSAQEEHQGRRQFSVDTPPPSYPQAPPRPLSISPPSNPQAPPTIYELAGHIRDFMTLHIKGVKPIEFFVKDMVLQEEIPTHGVNSIRVYVPIEHDRKNPRTKDKFRRRAYDKLDPDVVFTLPQQIREQLVQILKEQSAADRASFNEQNRQMIRKNYPVDGVAYVNDGAGRDEGPRFPFPFAHSEAELTFPHAYPPHKRPPRTRPQKRHQAPVDSMIDQEATAGEGNSKAALQAEFSRYLDIYQTIQANISDSLFPFFNAVLNGTNNSLIYDLVLSVHADLTGLGPDITGPYSYGMHCFDSLEKRYLNSTRISTDSTSNVTSTNGTHTKDPIYQQMLATHYVLIETYQYVWTNASAIANKTGLLTQLSTLTEYLNPADRSIMSARWTSVQKNFDGSYFTFYNRTVRGGGGTAQVP